MDRLRIDWKRDRLFKPRGDQATRLLHVYLAEGRAAELIATGPRWFDRRAGRGGSGAIDLACYLLKLDFKAAIKALRRSTPPGGHGRGPRRGVRQGRVLISWWQDDYH